MRNQGLKLVFICYSAMGEKKDAMGREKLRQNGTVQQCGADKMEHSQHRQAAYATFWIGMDFAIL